MKGGRGEGGRGRRRGAYGSCFPLAPTALRTSRLCLPHDPLGQECGQPLNFSLSPPHPKGSKPAARKIALGGVGVSTVLPTSVMEDKATGWKCMSGIPRAGGPSSPVHCTQRHLLSHQRDRPGHSEGQRSRTEQRPEEQDRAKAGGAGQSEGWRSSLDSGTITTEGNRAPWRTGLCRIQGPLGIYSRGAGASGWKMTLTGHQESRGLRLN